MQKRQNLAEDLTNKLAAIVAICDLSEMNAPLDSACSDKMATVTRLALEGSELLLRRESELPASDPAGEQLVSDARTSASFNASAGGVVLVC